MDYIRIKETTRKVLGLCYKIYLGCIGITSRDPSMQITPTLGPKVC